MNDPRATGHCTECPLSPPPQRHSATAPQRRLTLILDTCRSRPLQTGLHPMIMWLLPPISTSCWTLWPCLRLHLLKTELDASAEATLSVAASQPLPQPQAITQFTQAININRVRIGSVGASVGMLYLYFGLSCIILYFGISVFLYFAVFSNFVK